MNNKDYKKSATGTEPKSGKKRKAASGIYRLDNGPAELAVKPFSPPTYTASLSARTRPMTTTVGPNEEYEINKLYYELLCHAHKALYAAWEIGELLAKRKKQLPPDEWLPWLMNNVKFDETTAANYIAAFNSVYPFELATIDDVTFTCK